MNKVYTLLLVLLSVLFGGNVFGQTTYTWTGATGAAWLTAGNWSPTGGPPNSTTHIASFGGSNTATSVGLNTNTQSSTNLAAITFVSGTSTANLAIGNSGTSGSGGTITFAGTTINSVNNVVLRSTSAYNFTYQNNIGSGSKSLGFVLGNTTENIINIDGTGGITISSIISGSSRNLTKAGSGSGVLTLSGVNTYTGYTKITSGELRLNPSANNSLSGACIFNGGTLATTGITASRTITFGSIDLAENSTLALNNNAHTVTFTTAGTFTAGKVLTITGWTGTIAGCSAGTAGRIFVGSGASALSAAQLAQIKFTISGVDYPATLLSTGELVPTLKLVVTNPGNQIAGVGFGVTVTATDFNGTARNVPANTGITLTSATNTIGGTTTGTINSGSSAVTISGVTLSAGTNATITASSNAGFCLLPGTSTTFDVTTGSGFTVTFNANGGTGTMSPQNASSLTALNANTFTRTGYTFTGWNTVAGGGGTAYADEDNYDFTADITLYAQWSINSYTVTFNGNSPTSGSPSIASVSGNYATNVTLATIGTLLKTGYTFSGWNTLPDGSGTNYAGGASYTIGGSNITLYANWTPNNNTITFDGNGATGGSMSNQIIATGATATLTTNAYTRIGYTFAGWATTSGGTVAYADGASYTMGTASVTLYAVWNVYVGPCFSKDFESGNISEWTSAGGTTGGGTTGVFGSAGDYYLNLNENGEYAQLPVGANTYSSVSFNVKGSVTSNSWTLHVQYSSDGSSWNNALTIAGSSIGTSYSLQSTTIPTPSQYVRLYLIRTSNSCYIGYLDAFCVTCTPPTTQASSVTTNTPTTGGFSIGWTAGDGDGTMIVVRPTSSTNTLPSIKTSYTPNLAWTSAGQIDINNRVVFRNSGTAAGPVTGLTPETQYTITAYEYNNTDDCYNLTTPPSTTRWTLSTEPTAHPTSGFSGTTCNATSVDLTVPAISAGADGYLIIRKAGSAPTGLPTDATAYTVGNTFGDATVAAIVTASGTYTISGLTASTTYYFQLIPYNANSGAVAQTFNYLTSGTLLQTSVTTTATSTSAASTVETDATYGYTPNILYASYQSAPVPASASNSIGVHNIIIRDGGSTTDADALPTILTAISYSYTGTANTIRAAALFTTSGSKVADATTVGANTITFTGLSGSDVTTNDNNAGGAKELILRVTFNSTVTDNQKLVFTVTSVTGGAVCSYSQFAAADGGGAFSDNTTDDDNRIEVVADRIVFGTQPASTSVNTNLSAFTIRFQDVNGNLDFDNNRTVTLTATDGGVNMSASASYSITAPHSGIVAFSDVQFTSAPQTAITITANTTGLLTTNTVKSNPFDIFDIPVGSYRTTTDGVWSSSPANNTITWQELKSTGWETMALPSSTYPSTTTTNKVYIFNNVTLNGTNTAKNIIIESTGTLSTSTVTPTFKNLLIKTGGVFNKNPSNGLKFDTDGILEVENGGTFNYSHTNATSRSTNLWAGTEKFHPKSNFVVKETDNSVGSGNQIVESASDVSLFNGAMFGNFIVDMGTGGGKVPLFVSGLNTKLTNGDFILRTGSDNGMIFNNGNYTVTIGGDLIVESTYIQPFTLTNSASTVNFTVNGDVVHNGTAEFRLANSQTTNNPSVTLNIDSNLVIGSSNFIFDIGSSSTGTNKSVVNLKGDLTVGSGNILTQNTTAAKKGEFNFTGSYSSLDSTTIQTVDVASTGATTENARVDFNVKSGAYTQLINRDFELGTNSKLTVETGSIFDFGFNGSTALNVAVSGSQTGTAFESQQTSTLKITSPEGLYGNWNTTVFPSVTQAIGNLRLPKSNRTINNEATFWYIGKVNQQTGDAPNANNSAGTYSTTANGKVVICDLASNSISLTPSVSFGVAQSTAVSSTGGKLDIRKGQFIETEDQYIFGSTGTLYMAPSTLYKIVHGSATDPFGAGDDIPRMDGSGFPYVLTGGTIELGGTGVDHQYQRLRSDNAFYNYKYVKFSGNNTSGTFKNLNQTTTIDSALIITGSPIVDCFTGGTGSAASFVGNGGLIMDGGLLRIRKRTDTNPELEGINADYNLTGGTIEFYGTVGAGNRQQIRGNYGSPAKLVEYNNIEINADEARLPSTVTGNVDLTSSFTLKGTMNVNAPAILNMDSNDFIYKFSGNTTNNVNIKSGAGLTYGSPFGITTVAAGGTGIDPTVSPGGANPAAGNIRTNIRTFDANASYGFVSSGNMVSGSGLPATVKSLYVLKSNIIDRVSLTNSVRADSALRMFRGHIITGTNRVELGKDVTNRGTLDYTDGCYVVGNMRRWYDGTNTGDASGLYPLGEDRSGTLKNRKYLIEYYADPTGGFLDVNFNPVNMGLSGIPIMGIPAAGTCTSPFDVTTTEDEGYWIATPESGKLGDGTYKLSITGEDFSTVTDLCQLTLLKRVGAGSWTAPGTHLQPSGTINVPTVSRSGITGFSNFGFGGGAPNPLPVELTSFTASCKDDNVVEVRWTTATEFNSSYFILERSLDAARFETVAYVPAAVNSSTVRNYSVLDTGTVSNSNYYRLTEVDQSGKRTMYSLVYVRCREVNGWNAYHTPDGIVVEATTNSTKDIQIRLYEVSGKLLMQEKQVAQRGYNRYNMQMPALAKGVYIIQLLSGDDMESLKVWVP